MKKIASGMKTLTLGLLLLAFSTTAMATELTMFYPVAVGGPLTKLVDKLVQDFQT